MEAPSMASSTHFSPIAIMKEYVIIMLKYNEKNKQVIFIIFWCTQWYNSVGDLTRQHKVWSKNLLHYVFKIQTDPIKSMYREYSFWLNLLQCAYFIDIKLN